MNIKHIPFIVLLSLFGTAAMANQDNPAELRAKREHVIHQYIHDLGQADYNDITALFNDGGVVTSTSRGIINAQEFFTSFLSEIQTADTEFHQSFTSMEDSNHYGARFHFNFTLKDGETGDGEYVDEFIFADNSAKLTQVYMFENLKFTVNN
jgi:hypothetical protein